MPVSKTQRKNLRVMDSAKGKVLHPNSRRVVQMRRQMRRNIKVDGIKSKLRNVRSALASRAQWFREALQEVCALGTPTHEMVAALAEVFIRRNDGEIAFHKTARNPPKGQIKLLMAQKAGEEAQLNSAKGLPVPIVTTQDGLKSLLEWDGTDENAGKVHTEPVVRQLQSASQKAVVRAHVEEYAAALLKPFCEGDDMDFDDEDEDADGDDASKAVDPETQARRDKILGRNKLAKRRGAIRARITAKRAERQGAKAGNKVDASGATGRRLASQQRIAQYRRHKQLAMSRGLFN